MSKGKRILNRVRRWHRSDRGRAHIRATPVLAVALVALAVSYRHMYHVVLDAGEPFWVATILPLSVDGLLITAARYIGPARTAVGRLWAYGGFTLAMAATVAGNVLSAGPGPWGPWVAAWPAAAVILTGGILHWGGRKPRPKSRTRAPQRHMAPVNGHRAGQVGTLAAVR